MKRMHIHISVDDLDKSVGFYSALFGAKPSRQKQDYAKWMLDDPRVNFAISARGAKPGLDHLGIQVDAAEELSHLREGLKRADLGLSDEGETDCCYSRSDKSWVTDPSGIAWEAYHTMGDAGIFNGGEVMGGGACCAPKPVEQEKVQQVAPSCAPKSGCC